MSLTVLRTRDELSAFLRRLRSTGASLALVPTMGNLHRGHLALVERAAKLAERVAVSIFVNPTQFGPEEDFDRYPRTPEQDLAALSTVPCDLVFMPPVEEMYPFGIPSAVRVRVPGLSEVLCGERRPGHFDGVATVVLRLLTLFDPEVAVFGEKDYQQLLLVRRLVADLGLPVRIEGVPTVRDGDGLALSSRNAYLDAEDRARAVLLHRVLRRMGERWLAGEERERIEREALDALRAGGLKPEYAVIRRAEDLALPRSGERPVRALAAAVVGKARLIDNWPIP
ncbi:MAG: pantothenate synthetase [Lysobacterales bacterium]|jgi:pantoate--beta-alanine ligase|nr:MAG: pantothenate synthetase [Xanthomonadales bacterium]